MRPPRLARALVRLLARPDDRPFLLRDLAERYADLAARQGPRAAGRWYWSQALSAVRWSLLPDLEAPRPRWVAGLTGDVRRAARTLRRRPLYALGVSGTLALGVAAGTLVTAVAWRVWLSPMPYPDPDRVVRLYELEPAGAGDPAAPRRHRLSGGLLTDLQAHRWDALEGVSAVLSSTRLLWLRDDGRRTLAGVALSPDGFGILGVAPLLGRLPTVPEQEVMLSEGFWRAELGGDPEVLGTRMPSRWRSPEIVGVARLPAGYPGRADVVEVFHTDDDRDVRWLDAIARVRPGHTVAEAEAELTAFVAGLGEAHPQHRGWAVDAVVLADDLVGPFRGVLALLLAAGGTFLLLACVNVLGLVAARRVEGRRDRSIRLALGASEGRLLRGSLVESVTLAGAGSAVGVAAAASLAGPGRALVPHDVPRLEQVAVSPSLALAALGLGLGMGVVIGAVGWLVSRGAGPSAGRASGWRAARWRAAGAGGRRLVVVGQVALTAMLTAGAVAVLHRVGTLSAVDLGFEPEGVWSTTLSGGGDLDEDAWTSLFGQVVDGLGERGVQVAVGFNAPMRGEDEEVGMFPVRRADGGDDVFYQLHPVSPGYFGVLGIGAVAGRTFRPDDDRTAERVVVVSERFAREYLPTGSPIEAVIGRRLHPVALLREPATVIGVVRDTRHHGPDAPVTPDLYIPFAQQRTVVPRSLLVRGDPERLAEAITSATARADPDLRWTPLAPYDAHLREWFAPLRLQLVAVGVLGGLALVLAALGLHALMAYQVAVRRKELGIRKAVGATDGRLLRNVLAGGAATALAGTALGLVAWYRLLPLAAGWVDGLGAAGLRVPAWVALVVGGSCMIASLAPAVRATRVDPAAALKTE